MDNNRSSSGIGDKKMVYTDNGVQFTNESNQWKLVYTLIPEGEFSGVSLMCEESTGRTASIFEIFTAATEQECVDKIAELNLKPPPVLT